MSKKNFTLILYFFVFVTCTVSGAQKRTNKLRVAPTSQQSKDYGLFNAVLARDADKVKQILDEHYSVLSEAAINKAFVKTVRGPKNRHRVCAPPKTGKIATRSRKNGSDQNSI